MVSDVLNDNDALPWTTSDNRSFVGTPVNFKVSDIELLEARGAFVDATGTPLVLPADGPKGSLYFSLKGPGKVELIRIHLGSIAPTFTEGYRVGPTANQPGQPEPCNGENVIGLTETRYEIVSTGEFVDWNGLGNLKNNQLESVSLVLAVDKDDPNVLPKQGFFKLTCLELNKKNTTPQLVQFIPFQNESFVSSCALESEPGRAKVFVTRALDPSFFELVDLQAKSCQWEGAVNINSGASDTYTFRLILDDQPRNVPLNVKFGP
jgi:hypothetical protein